MMRRGSGDLANVDSKALRDFYGINGNSEEGDEAGEE